MATNPIALGQSLPTTIAPATPANGAASSAANATTINTAVTAVGLTAVNQGSQSPNASNSGNQQNGSGPSGYLLQAFGTALLQSGVSLFGPSGSQARSTTASTSTPSTSTASATTASVSTSAAQSTTLPATTPAAGTASTAAATQPTGTLPIRDAIHQFMHDLMTAVSAQQSAGAVSVSSPGVASSVSATGYTNMSSVLSGLIAQLSAPSATHESGGVSPNSLLSTLQTDFQQIVAASGGASTSPTSPSFDSFLQNLQYTISALGQASPSTTGSLINVTA